MSDVTDSQSPAETVDPPCGVPAVIATAKGEATVTVTDGQTVTLHAPFPSPPGSPLMGTLKGTSHDVKVKVHGCRALDPKASIRTYEIQGRWVSLTRQARDALLESRT